METMIGRRSLLLGILALGLAPAIARAGVLMPIRPLVGWDWDAIFDQMERDQEIARMTRIPIRWWGPGNVIEFKSCIVRGRLAT